MANITNLKIEALDIFNETYLSWILGVEIHLEAPTSATQPSLIMTYLLKNVPRQ